nr:T9SS type A sorting domain-containing protein [uncultured Flavobacterium sp.]
MKKITLLIWFMLTGILSSAQCIATSQYPSGDVISENEGTVQQITNCNYAGEYSRITNIIIGNNYQFTSTGGAGNYITITNDSNTVIASGVSPLTVNNMTVNIIRFHIFVSNACDEEEECRVTTLQCVSASCVPPPPPANDECANAVSLNVDSTFCNGANTNGSNENATDSGIAAATCFEYGENDVWFSFIVPATTATVNVSTDFTGGTLVDTEVALYSGTCGTLVEVGCDQDSGTTVLSNGFSWNSLLTNIAVTAGQTYYVRVSGYDASFEGTFCLRIVTNTTLASDSFISNEFKAYPNPVRNTLNLSNATEITLVAIYNMLGQEVLSESINATEAHLDMSRLLSGNYIVKVNSGGNTKTIKVVKH